MEISTCVIILIPGTCEAGAIFKATLASDFILTTVPHYAI